MRTRLIMAALVAVVLVFAGTSLSLAARSGKDVYEKVCKMCHGSGAMGAPKAGSGAWKKLLADEGIDELTRDAIKGKGSMPAKGTCGDCSEAEIKAAIEHMAK